MNKIEGCHIVGVMIVEATFFKTIYLNVGIQGGVTIYVTGNSVDSALIASPYTKHSFYGVDLYDEIG